MLRTISSAFVLAAILSAAGCGDGARETPFVSEAVAAPAQAPDYGWRTNGVPAGGEGTVTEYY